MNAWTREQGLAGEIRLIERQFDIYTAQFKIPEIYSSQHYLLQQS
ncbi:MAG: hypothetical protein NMNS01_24400 [Nitrosomonas sp.]|nr:MAG: hypothetical protein NMNS01_24400 [Nitrosomonas sp.]